MNDRPESLEGVLASVADGNPVDWDALSRDASPEERARMEALCNVSRIAAFSRSLQESGEPFAGKGPGGSELPERWGDLLLLERVSSGTGADVYRAWDVRLQREVALKLLRPSAPGMAAGADALALRNESRAAARIRHPNVVAVYGIEEHQGRTGFWMEFLRGVTLDREVAEGGPLDSARAIRLGLEIGSALAAVHEAGLLHRDIKPSNILRDAAGRYVLADFGLGRAADADSPGHTASGTPMYMAPELFAGEVPSERSDLYALGLTLWFALAGRHPFRTETLPELTVEARKGPASLAAEAPGVPAALRAVVERAVSPSPSTRFASARQLVESLGSLGMLGESKRTGERRRSLRPVLLAGAAALVVIPALVFLAVRSTQSPRPVELAMETRAVDPVPAPGVFAGVYDIEASFLKVESRGRSRLADGDRVKPGDRLALELRVSRPAWVYVLNEDERGEHYLLFPQPRFDLRNPVPADSTCLLPGTIGGLDNAWSVTSAGGREFLLVAVSPEPIAELEAELGRIPAAEPGRPIEYASVGTNAVETLRGVGGLRQLPPDTARTSPGARAIDRFRALAGRERGVEGVWVRQVVLENPGP